MTTTEPIRVGLLLCDHLDPDIAAVDGDYDRLYPAAFNPFGLDLRFYEAAKGELPDRTDECDVWMTSGSRRSAYEDEPWIQDVADLIARLAQERRPHVGICFGHQLTARALGGRVEPAASGWGVGGRTFDVVDPAPWMEPDVERFTLLTSHKDQVTVLPDGAQLIASADYCPVGAYRIDDHVFCVQGHPEFTPGVSTALMEQRRTLIGDATIDAGLASLRPSARPLDQRRVAAWIAEFYAQALTP